MKKCSCRGFNAECHYCSGTGLVAEASDDNPAGQTLRGPVNSDGTRWPSPGPKVIITKERRIGAQKRLKGERAYLSSVAESVASGIKPPSPPDALKEGILLAGGVGRWIASLQTRKIFYVAALHAAKRRLK